MLQNIEIAYKTLNIGAINSFLLICLELYKTKGMSLVPVPGNALIAVPIFNIAEDRLNIDSITSFLLICLELHKRKRCLWCLYLETPS